MKNTLIQSLIAGSLILASTAAFANFGSGQNFDCVNEEGDISVMITVVSAKDQLASVVVDAPNGVREYRKGSVNYQTNSQETTFTMVNNYGQIVETIVVDEKVSVRGEGMGYYSLRSQRKAFSTDMYCTRK